ncbi:MAG TPA: archaeosortase/exosortase family protein [Candidatus Sulfotelmatobacter sp.]|jgi:exosortase
MLFCALLALFVMLWWAPLTATFFLSIHNDQYTHILLILPISASLILLDWNSQDVSMRSSLPIASLLLAAVLANFILGRTISLPGDILLTVRMFTFVLCCLAGFVLCFGATAFRNLLFPVLFLLWLVPFPGFVVNAIVSALQYSSAAAAHAIFVLARVPVEQRGLLLHIPGLTLEVAPECSSIRSSLVLLVTTMVLAHLLLRSWWRKLLLIALAIPLAIIKNGLRIFVIGFLAIRVDRSYLFGRLHHQGGFIFLLIALAGIFLALWILRRGEIKQPAGRNRIPA